ncbi:MAG: glycosyltransferase family 4 protein [Deltaproteobacteria bacterium]|jgi:glycosyltransferase involved in cell wall biosynthesis|nr:glycosyltransferase family 4 protein [Deltaproteobacteria bacterium]MBW2543713.1 glycosyltransferase family 4 protein [Deltaproteobacteria bacterium]
MKILIVAPQPFYQERGTPISVDFLIRALLARGDDVDLLTYHEGVDRTYERLRIFRIEPFPPIHHLRPGFSAKKLYCDVFLFFRLIPLLRENRYDVVHAVEEGSLMALLLCPLRSIPFVCDVDSSMTTQLVDRFGLLRPFRPLLERIEAMPYRKAAAVVPMCDALADSIRRYRPKQIVVLKDVSLVREYKEWESAENLAKNLHLDGPVAMYIGNLGVHQGIDLLLAGFAIAVRSVEDASLIIIGGAPSEIHRYRVAAKNLGIGKRVHFLGPRPVEQIGLYMKQADVLVSPRKHGVNTPMKVYSYLDSGVAVLATRRQTHTQVMTHEIAMLAEPSPDDLARGLVELFEDPDLRERLARNARAQIQREHSYAGFRERVHELYARLEEMRP